MRLNAIPASGLLPRKSANSIWERPDGGGLVPDIAWTSKMIKPGVVTLTEAPRNSYPQRWTQFRASYYNEKSALDELHSDGSSGVVVMVRQAIS